MPHMALHLDILDLQIRDGGFKMRIPVDQTLAAIDQRVGAAVAGLVVVHLHKDLDHGVVEVARLTGRGVRSTRHGERLTVPIATRTQPLQLPDDRAARLDLLLPDPGHEFLPPHGAAVGHLIEGHVAFGHHLGRNPGMVGADLPQRVKTPHPVPADQNILQRVVKGMAHVERAGDIRRRDHDRERLRRRTIRLGLGIGPGSAHLALGPQLGDPGFRLSGVEGLFHRHRGNPEVVCRSISEVFGLGKAKWIAK